MYAIIRDILGVHDDNDRPLVNSMLENALFPKVRITSVFVDYD